MVSALRLPTVKTGRVRSWAARSWNAIAGPALALVTSTAAQGPAPIATSICASIRSSGAITASWPFVRNAAAVRCASGSGRVRRSRTASAPREEIVAAAAFEFAAGVGAKFDSLRAGAFARYLESFAAVRFHDDAAEVDSVVADPRVAANRGTARAIEHRKKRAFGGERGRGIGIADFCHKRARRDVVGAGLDADGTLADRGQKFVDVQQSCSGGEQ